MEISAVDLSSAERADAAALPTVTIVFLVFNRREELRRSLREMLDESDYPRDRLEVVVVDNASQDGSAAMVRDEFPEVRLIRRERNSGVSGWNDGFAVARGDWVLALDDDCYLPGDALRRAVASATSQAADLVSFAVESAYDRSYRFDLTYRTGMFSFWGCAALVRREVVDALGGYDPQIFVWANELEFTLRFYDRGFRHLHLPEIAAVHMKQPGGHWTDYVPSRAHRLNARHFAYVAAKLFGLRDALAVLGSLLLVLAGDAATVDRMAVTAMPEAVRGFAHGLRHRAPLRNPEIARFYRDNFETFARPWRISRPPAELARALPRELPRALARRNADRPAPERPDRRAAWFAERADLYPTRATTLRF